MSGAGAPGRTATPSPTRPTFTRSAAPTLPAFANCSIAAGGEMTTSNMSPAAMRFGDLRRGVERDLHVMPGLLLERVRGRVQPGLDRAAAQHGDLRRHCRVDASAALRTIDSSLIVSPARMKCRLLQSGHCRHPATGSTRASHSKVALDPACAMTAFAALRRPRRRAIIGARAGVPALCYSQRRHSPRRPTSHAHRPDAIPCASRISRGITRSST